MDDLVRAGKVLMWDISIRPAWQVSRMQAICGELRGWSTLTRCRIEYSLIERTCRAGPDPAGNVRWAWA